MRSLPLTLALGAVRAWTRTYTCGLPEALAAERRAEIDSDLWEFQHDPATGSGWPPAAQVLARLLSGVTDDLVWRVERTSLEDVLVPRHFVVLTATVFLLLAWWILPATSSADLRQGGRARVADCAAAATAPKSTAELRLLVMECAGAFFTRRARRMTIGPE